MITDKNQFGTVKALHVSYCLMINCLILSQVWNAGWSFPVSENTNHENPTESVVPESEETGEKLTGTNISSGRPINDTGVAPSDSIAAAGVSPVDSTTTEGDIPMDSLTTEGVISTNSTAFGSDILLTLDQKLRMMEVLSTEATSNEKRQKRDMGSNLEERWGLPISYKFDGSHTEEEKFKIRAAFKHWEENTCVRFAEVALGTRLTGNHLLLTKTNSDSCSSFVGKINLTPQPINLAAGCFGKLGVAVHEIGHALGLWHEHQRADRDDYIDVDFNNIALGTSGNFALPSPGQVVSYDVPYDFNSIMHYAGEVGELNPGSGGTIKTKDPLFQRNIGQRDGLSFWDARLVNNAYCSANCKSAKPLKCQNGGYLDPNVCTQCRCPSGLSGQICDKVAPSIRGSCGGYITLNGSSPEAYIVSPGFDQGGMREEGLECNYLLKASNGKISIRFEDRFSIVSSTSTCEQFVEIRYRKNLSLSGPRFCGTSLPDVKLGSESDQVLILFRSGSDSYARFKIFAQTSRH